MAQEPDSVKFTLFWVSWVYRAMTPVSLGSNAVRPWASYLRLPETDFLSDNASAQVRAVLRLKK